MASRGLQRLRWYCQACEKQCRDANGFRCHTMSEPHVRQMHTLIDNPRAATEQFSRDFLSDFIRLLRTSHGEKYVNANRFYSGEYIKDKQHVHMNATKWPSLTEFVKFLGREGICLVKEEEKDGLCIAWKDTSLQAEQRRQEIQQAEDRDTHDSDENRILRKMEQRAKAEAAARAEKAKSRTDLHISQRNPENSFDEQPDPNDERTTPQLSIKFNLKPKVSPKDIKRQVSNRNILKRAPKTPSVEIYTTRTGETA
ncbi:domain of Kin17 curved DNA-binding protein-domain-containing protein [Massariosphaeria phaeospora]|uniref:Domain of Kin17 curved DNA-binding protein-domain-containing protein n=1 Tax=Massariosphaeria phaeospora TaxID=100035 RepID=A0A7C8MUP9_9PLEO|nr:domain of Kin17 curved DNA-binding protein-domain-containing protein [Massariosphaeria phaeospora]